MKFKKIIPERERCFCGKKVQNHHWLCDKCYSKKANIQKRIDKYKLLRNKEQYLRWKNKMKEFKKIEKKFKMENHLK